MCRDGELENFVIVRGVLLETDMTAFLPNTTQPSLCSARTTWSYPRLGTLVILQAPKVQLPIVVPGRLPQVPDTIQ